MLGEIAEGKIPLDDPDKTFAWMMNWSTVLERLQAPLYADVDTLVPRAVQRLLNPFRNHHATVEGILLEDPLDRGPYPYPSPLDEEQAHKRSLMGNPQTAYLLGQYIRTGNPKLADLIKQQLFEPPALTEARQGMEELRKSPGAVAFDEWFGQGAGDHLISAGDPINVIANMLPFLRGAKIAGAVEKTAGLKLAAKETAKGAGQMAVIGAEQHITANPQSTPEDILRAALDTAGKGTLISAGTAGGIHLWRKGVDAAKAPGKPEIGVDDFGAGDFSKRHVRAEPIVSELLQDPSALQSFERSVRERESALRTEVSARGIEVRTDDQSAHQRARVSITDRGDIILSIRSDLARNTFAEAKGNEKLATSLAREILHEERLHVATLSVWRDDWSGVGRRGSYRDYVRNRSVSLLGDMRSAVDKMPPADKAKSLEALHTAWASYFDPEGKRTDVTPPH